jgi:hypothetical protein
MPHISKMCDVIAFIFSMVIRVLVHDTNVCSVMILDIPTKMKMSK